MSSDVINSLFESISGLLTLISVYRLYKDKELKGVSIYPTLFFTLWGFWNIYFYSYNNFPYSFYGGLLITIVNVIWLSMIYYYKFKYKKNDTKFKK